MLFWIKNKNNNKKTPRAKTMPRRGMEGAWTKYSSAPVREAT